MVENPSEKNSAVNRGTGENHVHQKGSKQGGKMGKGNNGYAGTGKRGQSKNRLSLKKKKELGKCVWGGGGWGGGQKKTKQNPWEPL